MNSLFRSRKKCVFYTNLCMKGLNLKVVIVLRLICTPASDRMQYFMHHLLDQELLKMLYIRSQPFRTIPVSAFNVQLLVKFLLVLSRRK